MRLIFTLAILTVFTFYLKAQVTIGSNHAPSVGALLQLKENDGTSQNSTKGMMLPRVSLVDITNLYPMFLETDGSVAATYQANKSALDAAHTGMVVYNTNNKGTDICKGLYVWDGDIWQKLHKGICEYIEASPSILRYPAIGATLQNLVVSSNIDWLSVVNTTDLDPTKISSFTPQPNTIQPSTGGTDVNIGINLGENGIDKPAREFLVTIEGQLTDGTSKQIPIVLQQEEGPKSRILFTSYSGSHAPTTQSIDTDGNMTINITNNGDNGQGTYNVDSNIPWTVEYVNTGNNGHNTLIETTTPANNVESPAGSSLTFDPSLNGIGCPSRSAQLKLKNTTYNKSAQLTVTQDAGAAFVLNASAPYTYANTAGNYPINVASNKDYAVTAFDNSTGIMNNAGNGITYPAGTATFNLGINANAPGCPARNGSITISSTPDCGTTQSVAVPFTQNAGDALYLQGGNVSLSSVAEYWGIKPATNADNYRVSGINDPSGMISGWTGHTNWISSSTQFTFNFNPYLTTNTGATTRSSQVYFEATNCGSTTSSSILFTQPPAIVEHIVTIGAFPTTVGFHAAEGCFNTTQEAINFCASKGTGWSLPFSADLDALMYAINVQYICTSWTQDYGAYTVYRTATAPSCPGCIPARCRFIN